MKKHVAVLMVLAAIVGLSATLKAAETSFIPTPSADMWDLDHWRYYTWGVDLGFTSVDTQITEATLTFKNIRNYSSLPNVLYIHLLDGNGVKEGGLVAGRDFGWFGDHFAGQGVLIDAWTNDGTAVDLVYTFSGDLLAALNDYAADGYIGFGFDPDCHYYNDGITFGIVTEGAITTAVVATPVVPAPGAIVLAGIGTTVVGWLRRRKAV